MPGGGELLGLNAPSTLPLPHLNTLPLPLPLALYLYQFLLITHCSRNGTLYLIVNYEPS